jgi:hypothetical protein
LAEEGEAHTEEGEEHAEKLQMDERNTKRYN